MATTPYPTHAQRRQMKNASMEMYLHGRSVVNHLVQLHCISTTRPCCVECGYRYDILGKMVTRALKNVQQEMAEQGNIEPEDTLVSMLPFRYEPYRVENAWSHLFMFCLEMPQYCNNCKLVYLHDVKVVAEMLRQAWVDNATLGDTGCIIRLSMLMQHVHKLPLTVVKRVPLGRLMEDLVDDDCGKYWDQKNMCVLTSTAVWYTPAKWELKPQEQQVIIDQQAQEQQVIFDHGLNPFEQTK
jgi:hypothetical protein